MGHARTARTLARRSWLALAPRLFLRWARPDTDELGRAGEELAARALRRRGWRLRGRRVATPCGEVDLWAARAGRALCVEVKTGRVALVPRPAGQAPGATVLPWDLRWRPGLRVDRARFERLRRCAAFLGGAGERRARVDLIEVLVADDGGRVELLQHRDLRAPPFPRC